MSLDLITDIILFMFNTSIVLLTITNLTENDIKNIKKANNLRLMLNRVAFIPIISVANSLILYLLISLMSEVFKISYVWTQDDIIANFVVSLLVSIIDVILYTYLFDKLYVKPDKTAKKLTGDIKRINNNIEEIRSSQLKKKIEGGYSD